MELDAVGLASLRERREVALALAPATVSLTTSPSRRLPSRGHSAHIGREVVVHLHPFHGRRALVHYSEQRAGGSIRPLLCFVALCGRFATDIPRARLIANNDIIAEFKGTIGTIQTISGSIGV
jgi:hypothetical protein